MREIVIDSSIALKWFLNESDSEIALQIYKDIKSGRVKAYAPTLLLLEVSNVLVKSKQVDISLIKKAMNALISSPIVFVDLDSDNFEEITDLMTRYKLTSYDAIYLQVAKSKNATVISEDNELLSSQGVVNLETFQMA